MTTPLHALETLMKSLDARLIRRGDDKTGTPYLWRGYLSDRKKEGDSDFGAFLHRFVSSDSWELHCHPWEWSWAFIIDGAYVEERATGRIDFATKTAILDPTTRRKTNFVKGDKNIITADTFHRVELLTPEVWTLFIHGPRVQNWGFVPMGVFDEPVSMRLMEGHTRDRLEKQEIK